MSFIWATYSKQTDYKKKIQAITELCSFSSKTTREEEEALTMLALAYSAAGDHHRAIEDGSRTSSEEEFPSDGKRMQ